MSAAPTRLQAWSQLLRVPNLATVPGDPMVGAVLAAGGQALLWRPLLGSAAAALCLYMVGLILNDLHDLADDRVNRPERPLPRQLISVRAAIAAALLLAALGLLAALSAGPRTALAGLGLLGLIGLYTFAAKAAAPTACLVMGLCRGGSVLLGAAAAGWNRPALLAAAAWAVTIGSVTWLSRGEDRRQRPGWPVLLPPLAMAGGLAAAWAGLPEAGALARSGFAIGAAAAFGLALRQSLRLFHRDVSPAAARAAVGGFIALLVPWQAAVVLLGDHPGTLAVALGLLALWPLSRRLARHFSAS